MCTSSTKYRYSLIKKIHPCVFPFRCSHFTHARILHVLPSLQQETWCTFTDSQGSANNIHTHGCKSRYTLEHTQTAFQHSNIALAYSDMYKLICSPLWLVLLTRADTGTFTHINILRSHSHEYYHTLTHVHTWSKTLTLMRFVCPQCTLIYKCRPIVTQRRTCPGIHLHTNNKAHSEAHKFSDINTLTFTDTHICAFPQIQPYINKITQKNINMLTCVHAHKYLHTDEHTHSHCSKNLLSMDCSYLWTGSNAHWHCHIYAHMQKCSNKNIQITKTLKHPQNIYLPKTLTH